MKPKLLLYFECNIIIPVSCDSNGRSHDTEFIYYTDDPHKEYIDIIRDFYQRTTGTNTIDTHFVFAETMDATAKKSIIQEFSNEGFIPKSYTAVPSIILTEYVLKRSAAKEAVFGENIAILFSNDDSLRLTGTVFDGSSWKWNYNYITIPKVGNSPLKRALTECLITERDKNLGALDERKRERELQYQIQFADEWLSQYKGLESHEDLITDFKFTFEDSSVKLRIPKRVIEQYYEQTLAPAVSSISSYKDKAFSCAIKYAVLVGPAFEEENFTIKVKNILECQDFYSIIPYTKMASALARYLETCELSDDFSKFDQVSAEVDKMHKNEVEWIQYAKTLTDFNEELNSELSELSRRVANDSQALESILTSSYNYLQTSDFDKSKEVLSKTFFPTTLTKNSLQEARHLLARKENMESIFAKLEIVDGARMLIRKIEENSESLRTAIAASEGHQEAIKDRLSKTVYYEEHFDEYLDLKKQFNRAKEYLDRKKIVEKMRPKTLEPLPELKLSQVFAEIKFTREKVKVGLFKKKDVIHITVSVKDGDVLPCEAVLNVSNKAPVRASEGDADCLAFEIEKGASTCSVDVDSTECSLDFSKDIYCSLFTGIKVLDKTAIKCYTAIIK